MPRLLSRAEVAKYLSCSSTTVDRLRAAKKLPSFKVGDMVRFREEDIVRYIEQELSTTQQLQGGKSA